jgi:hypothetical protein
MALSRAAAAVGAGVALGDILADRATEAALLADLSLYSNRVSISSGVEVTCNEVVVFGRAPGWAEGIVAGVAPMADLLDLAGVQAASGPAQFFHNGRPIGSIANVRLKRAFFAIWLDPRTSAPDLRNRLIGTTSASK